MVIRSSNKILFNYSIITYWSPAHMSGNLGKRRPDDQNPRITVHSSMINVGISLVFRFLLPKNFRFRSFQKKSKKWIIFIFATEFVGGRVSGGFCFVNLRIQKWKLHFWSKIQAESRLYVSGQMFKCENFLAKCYGRNLKMICV